MKIAAYCRVSTEKEAQIDSLEKQIEFFNEFTKKNGYELYKLYADEGISGKQIKHRKQFQQMMQDAKAKKKSGRSSGVSAPELNSPASIFFCFVYFYSCSFS